MLDVNAGIPLADEPAILGEAIQIVQSVTDAPICIDSSIVAALQRGLEVYEGKALVNSVTAEDERLEQILPLVKKYDAAVIALPNDADEIPMESAKRVELVAKIVRVATEEYGIPLADIAPPRWRRCARSASVGASTPRAGRPTSPSGCLAGRRSTPPGCR